MSGTAQRAAAAAASGTRMTFTADDAVQTLAANVNNRAIRCGRGRNGWNYICSFLNGVQPDRAGFVLNRSGGSPLMVYLPAQGPVPAPHQ
jgi:hypothetical protein